MRRPCGSSTDAMPRHHLNCIHATCQRAPSLSDRRYFSTAKKPSISSPTRAPPTWASVAEWAWRSFAKSRAYLLDLVEVGRVECSSEDQAFKKAVDNDQIRIVRCSIEAKNASRSTWITARENLEGIGGSRHRKNRRIGPCSRARHPRSHSDSHVH